MTAMLRLPFLMTIRVTGGTGSPAAPCEELGPEPGCAAWVGGPDAAAMAGCAGRADSPLATVLAAAATPPVAGSEAGRGDPHAVRMARDPSARETTAAGRCFIASAPFRR